MSNSTNLSQRFRSANQDIRIPTQVDPTTGEHFIFWSDVQSAFSNAVSIRDGEVEVPFLEDGNSHLPMRIAYHPDVELIVVENRTNPIGVPSDPVGESSESGELRRFDNNTIQGFFVIRTLVETTLARNCGLLDAPIPRLFIVLPTVTRALGGFTSLSPGHFRLYFLCECGARTLPEGSRTLDHIHLAKHEGYDLEKPIEFFKSYSSYLLIMMNMIKYGVTSADTVVPPTTTSKVLDGINTTPEHLLYLNENLAALVESTIAFLDGIKRDIEQSTTNTGFEKDLTQLETHLKIKDQGRSLGNLYRAITTDGHVKWVCQDHHKAYYQDSSVRQLRNTFNGAIVEEIGRIEVTLYTSDKAKRFYEAMVKSRVVQELKVTLGWNATMDQLKALAKAVTKSNVVRLEIDGTHFTGLTLDVINRGRRFDPILQLPSNGQIQSLHLSGFHKFFTRVKDTSFVHSPKLREFSLHSEFPINERARSLNNLFDNYSALKTLELRLEPQYLLTEVTGDILSKLNSLNSFTIMFDRLDVTAAVSQGEIQDVELTIAGLQDLALDDVEFIRLRHFSQLDIQYIEKEYTRRKSRCSRRTRAGRQGKKLTIIARTGMGLQSLVEFATSDTLKDLEKISINHGNFLLTTNVSQRAVQDMTMDIERLGNLNHTDVAFINEGHLIRLTIQSTLQEANEDRLATILRRSPKLTYLGIGCEGSRAAAVVDLVTSTREKILQEGGSSALRTFELMDEKMTPFDLHGECDDSTHIQIHVSLAENSDTFDMRTWIRLPNSTRTETPLRDFARQYGWSIVFLEEGLTRNGTFATILDNIPDTRPSQLETLSFDASKFAEPGFERLKKIVQLPNFKTLGLSMKLVNENLLELLRRYGSKLFKLHLYGASGRWLPRIAALFPTRTSLPNLTSFGVQLSDDVASSDWFVTIVSKPADSCKGMEKIVLKDIRLQPEGLKKIIEAIDITRLQHLDLNNLPRDSMQLMTDRLPMYELSKTSLTTLKLNNTDRLKGVNTQHSRERRQF